MTFAGVYPILYAFFGADGQLDEGAMRSQVRACLASGAHGIAVLGLITEVGKLSSEERRAVVSWAADEVRGRVPLAVTIAGPDISTQIEDARIAQSLGADLVIFQPPGDCWDEKDLMRAFGHAADALDHSVGIQNAPQYLGKGIGVDAIRDLHRQHPNFCVLKGEASAVEIAKVVDQCGDGLAVFNGRGGLELPDILRAGCVGMIPAPECCDVQIRIFDAFQLGQFEKADALYAEALPLITFVMQSIDASLIYGKRITARRLGLSGVVDRGNDLTPTPFGSQIAEARSAFLGPFPLE